LTLKSLRHTIQTTANLRFKNASSINGFIQDKEEKRDGKGEKDRLVGLRESEGKIKCMKEKGR